MQLQPRCVTGKEPKGVMLNVDDKSTICLLKNPVYHGRCKNTDTRHRYLRVCFEESKFDINYVWTDD